MPVTVVESTDVAAIAALSAAVQNEHHQRRPYWFKPHDLEATRRALSDIATDPEVRCLIAYLDGIPAGYVLLIQHQRPESAIRHADRYLEIDQMSVDPEFRRRGIASALIERVRKFAHAENFDRIRLTVWSDNEAARAFYKTIGFNTFRETMELEP